jgi:hypothetical protein
MKILFVDDQKDPRWYKLPDGTPWAKTVKRAVQMWKKGDYDTLYLDYDMGYGKNGLDVLRECIAIRPPAKVVLITWNFAGRHMLMGECKTNNIPFEVSLGD